MYNTAGGCTISCTPQRTSPPVTSSTSQAAGQYAGKALLRYMALYASPPLGPWGHT